ncbi:MAG: UDP-N-acetylmuramoyl-L-alanyl-D-glutamate--2,6-diaminopimelate ligase [Sedimentisphaerales bacterium]|nr:UDP-N-acetylmuramoyl-L-alanyl-D-glutamate--2,6-diaminopimelate ligase [Sedimentisphaerales bacterium]
MTIEQLIEVLVQDPALQVCIDSRKVRPSDVFVAIRGTHQDGHRFIDQAISNGAKYIVFEPSASTADGRAIWIPVPDTTEALAKLAQARYNWPASRLTNLAVTGTNGKTTVAYLVRACLQKAGIKCGLIGTIVYDTGLQVRQADLTTPDSLALANLQQEMLKAGCTHMIMEASSHALAQGRCKGIGFRAAAFTNLTQDHLDYHKDIHNYGQAKAILFEGLDPDAWAVLNANCPHAKYMAESTRAVCIWYGIGSSTDLTACILGMDACSTRYVLGYGGRQVAIDSPLLGLHNVSNHLAAAGLCLALGLDLGQIKQGLESLRSIPGRLERIDWSGSFSVIVDFAHTEDALRRVLATLRPLCNGRLIVVFGCGGDRDKGKRPRMGRAAQELADIVVITSDNPRTEDPDLIIHQILSGLIDPDPNCVHVEPDRRTAIGWAISRATSGDIVLIAGKGHENYQIVGTEKRPFSDQEVAIECLRGLRP